MVVCAIAVFLGKFSIQISNTLCQQTQVSALRRSIKIQFNLNNLCLKSYFSSFLYSVSDLVLCGIFFFDTQNRKT